MIQKIAIYGAGAIGGWMGVRLAASGCDASVVARGDTLAALQRNGLQLQRADGTCRAANASLRTKRFAVIADEAREGHRRDLEIDRRTRHGELEGARLP